MPEDKKPKTIKVVRRKYVAIRKFGTDAGTVNVGDVCNLTAAEAKPLNKAKALAPFIEDDEDEDE